MSGHNKWSQIKHQKASTDLKRGRIFSKITNAISAAVKSSGADQASNIRLRLLLDQAKQINLPNENVQRAILRGKGELPGVKIEEIVYGAYGPVGIAILIYTTTDNRNRTSANIKSILNRHGGRLAESGSLSYLFEQKGILSIKLTDQTINKDEIELIIMDSGASDFTQQDDLMSVYTFPRQLDEVKQFLQQKNINISEAVLSYEPKNVIKIEDSDQVKQIIKLMNALDEIEEVNDIYSNFEISDKILEGNYL
jgi:YebC/PmpR family DNA-binding regulatory protein